MFRFITKKGKGAICLTTLLVIISLDKSPAADGTCIIDADVFTSRQAMACNKAWQCHGCYHLGSDALYNLLLLRASVGCSDDWNLLDHFDPTADVRRLYKQFFDLLASFLVPNDAFPLVQNGNLTYEGFLPFLNRTKRRLWSISRGGLAPLWKFTFNDTVCLLYTNEHTVISYSGNCTTC